ncbi:MAG TPA: aspartyl protease family protein [Thermoanaerobaculia bacterium]|nr:aspartyl protease family protein [Thermoanaerobaculia bacterium]
MPPPVLGQLLLDTGASRTCIGQSAVRELGLTPLRLQPGFGAGGLHESAVYRVRMTIRLANETGVTEIHWESEAQEIPSLEESVAPLGLMHSGQPVKLVGLLGRDILRHARFLYDGIAGRIEINFDLDSLNRFSEKGRVVLR